jgi:hypothetical protein
MPFGRGTVFVLGAGFTKGFFPNAPLLVDNYDVRGLLDAADASLSEHSKGILRSECRGECLMTENEAPKRNWLCCYVRSKPCS